MVTVVRLTPRWSGRVRDKVPSPSVGVRAAQLNRWAYLRYLVAVLLSVLGVAVTAGDGAVPPFKRESVDYAFAQMHLLPGFDAAKPQRWGYFFIAADNDAFAALRQALSEEGYKFDYLSQDNDGLWWLEMSREEVHSPASLHDRNLFLFGFARRFPGVTYDGWDITAPGK